MLSSTRIYCGIAALCLGLAVVACDDSSPVAPDRSTTLSGTVVYSQSGEPAGGVDVDLERCERGMGMMMTEEWHPCDGTMTDSHGEFHFEYTHESMHRYRVRVSGAMDPQGMCYLDGADGEPVVLRVP